MAGERGEHGSRRPSADAEAPVLPHHEALGHVVRRDLAYKSKTRPVAVDLREVRVAAVIGLIVIEVAIPVVTVTTYVRLVELGEVISVELDEPSQHRSVSATGLK